MITSELYTDMIDDSEISMKLNDQKIRDAWYSDWWEYNYYFMYPNEQITKNTSTHNKDKKGLINILIPIQQLIKKSITPKN